MNDHNHNRSHDRHRGTHGARDALDAPGATNVTNVRDASDALDIALLQIMQAGTEPQDAGFSQRVMAALPNRADATRQQRQPPGHRLGRRLGHRLDHRSLGHWLEPAQWAAASLAAVAAAALIAQGSARFDTPQEMAALALLGLMIFWSIPSQWNRD